METELSKDRGEYSEFLIFIKIINKTASFTWEKKHSGFD